MSQIPLIGLPTLAIPPGPKPPRFGINQSYVRALTAAGCAPVLIPILDDDDRLRAIYERLDGIVFPGGADIAPEEYGDRPLDNLNVVEPPRGGSPSHNSNGTSSNAGAAATAIAARQPCA